MKNLSALKLTSNVTCYTLQILVKLKTYHSHLARPHIHCHANQMKQNDNLIARCLLQL